MKRFHDKATGFGDLIPAKDGEYVLYSDHLADKEQQQEAWRRADALRHVENEKLESVIASRDLEIERLRKLVHRMTAACGIPDVGDALRMVIKIGKEAQP